MRNEALEIYESLNKRGFTLWIEGEKLRCKPKLDIDDAGKLREHKATIISILAKANAKPSSPVLISLSAKTENENANKISILENENSDKKSISGNDKTIDQSTQGEKISNENNIPAPVKKSETQKVDTPLPENIRRQLSELSADLVKLSEGATAPEIAILDNCYESLMSAYSTSDQASIKVTIDYVQAALNLLRIDRTGKIENKLPIQIRNVPSGRDLPGLKKEFGALSERLRCDLGKLPTEQQGQFEILVNAGKAATLPEEFQEINYGFRCLIILLPGQLEDPKELIQNNVTLVQSPDTDYRKKILQNSTPPNKATTIPPELLERFRKLVWPKEPFMVGGWLVIQKPELYRQWLEEHIELGEKSPMCVSKTLIPKILQVCDKLEMLNW
ncbi:MAG: hypothetical protein HQM08_27325 [Candidatus Riflebacteria bacterium]|nr:hypothetical protein [Candidatus Riflebacteria bacterium]